MQYIYMDNFRGFKDTFVPLADTNFLVGENSTGKSSFLNLVYVMSQRDFFLSPSFTIEGVEKLGNFYDIVSAWSRDKSSFQVGVIASNASQGKGLEIGFNIFTFSNKEGTPVLSKYINMSDDRITTMLILKGQSKFRVKKVRRTPDSESGVIGFVRHLLEYETASSSGFRKLPKNFPSHLPLTIQLGFVRQMKRDSKALTVPREFKWSFGRVLLRTITWIAPIRTKPQRFYDTRKAAYSPEGEHIPFQLHYSLQNPRSSRLSVKKLTDLGRESGLFNAIVTHAFGDKSLSPFEILITLSRVKLNITNVGYGVSQVLPLLVEFLGEEKKRAFAVQQPEVHLHPKAQAVLGELIYDLAKNQKHTFLIETHSDYLIDRFRLAMRGDKNPPTAQVMFFSRVNNGNQCEIIQIQANGRYPNEQPPEFRDFFIKEAMDLLEL